MSDEKNKRWDDGLDGACSGTKKTIFDKLDAIIKQQIHHQEQIERITQVLYVEGGARTRFDVISDNIAALNNKIDKIEIKRQTVISTAQAIWAIILGLLSLGNISLAIILTFKKL